MGPLDMKILHSNITRVNKFCALLNDVCRVQVIHVMRIVLSATIPHILLTERRLCLDHVLGLTSAYT
jgi:hypothetical protein